MNKFENSTVNTIRLAYGPKELQLEISKRRQCINDKCLYIYQVYP